jgi:hypothetical protein
MQKIGDVPRRFPTGQNGVVDRQRQPGTRLSNPF